MRITVVGTGYVGLVAGTCFADSGQNVTCVDINPDKIALLNGGGLPIYEPGLRSLVSRGVKAGRLSFSTDLQASVARSKVVFICVGTPPDKDGRADMQYVHAAARDIGKAMLGFTIVVLKSTVPVGTADEVRAILKEETKESFAVVSNPEFLKEGAAIHDFTKPDRVVIGIGKTDRLHCPSCKNTISDEVVRTMQEIYAPFLRTDKPFLVMDNRSAELTKYAANALLATKISFINDMANLAEQVGADISQVRRGIGTDARIGFQFLFPGVGYGGSCFPKDVEAIIDVAKKHGHELRILDAVQDVNRDQKATMANKVLQRFGEDLSGKTFAVWGLAFKPGTDDMREAPSITIINRLLEAGAKVRAHDPEAQETAGQEFGDRIEIVEQPFDALPGATALLVVTEWKPYRRPDFEEIKEALVEPVIFDGRNLYEPDRLEELGIEYYGVGRGRQLPGKVEG